MWLHVSRGASMSKLFWVMCLFVLSLVKAVEAVAHNDHN